MDGPPWAWGRAASEPPSCSRSGPGGRNTPSENRRWARPPAGRSSSPGATLSPDVNVRGGSGSSPPPVRGWDAAGRGRSGLGCPASSSTWGLPGLGASRASTAGTPGLGGGWQEPSSGGPAAGEPRVSGGRRGGPRAAVLWASAHWGWRGEPASSESRQGDSGPEPKASAGRLGLGAPPFSKVGPGPGGTRGWRTCKRKSGPVTARLARGGPCPPPRETPGQQLVAQRSVHGGNRGSGRQLPRTTTRGSGMTSSVGDCGACRPLPRGPPPTKCTALYSHGTTQTTPTTRPSPRLL